MRFLFLSFLLLLPGCYGEEITEEMKDPVWVATTFWQAVEQFDQEAAGKHIRIKERREFTLSKASLPKGQYSLGNFGKPVVLEDSATVSTSFKNTMGIPLTFSTELAWEEGRWRVWAEVSLARFRLHYLHYLRDFNSNLVELLEKDVTKEKYEARRQLADQKKILKDVNAQIRLLELEIEAMRRDFDKKPSPD